jgi:hypothetical protein
MQTNQEKPPLAAQSVLGRLRSSWLFRREVPLQNAREVIGWWEARRLPYNLIVCIAGVVSCIAVGIFAVAAFVLFKSDDIWPNPPLFALVWGFSLRGRG